jgi:DNA-binding transcriptional LysR family regulator
MDDMSRLNRLAELWSWLPAFRAVAETEHVSEAAEATFTSASSLSRAIRLLEDNVGHDLFDRQGRNIQLNARGKAFLRRLRQAMRLVDEAVTEASRDEHVGKISLGAPPRLQWLFRPGLDSLLDELPNVTLHLGTTQPDMQERLLRGDLDIAFVVDPAPRESLSIDLFCEVENGLYAGPGHELYDSDKTFESEDLEEYSFVGPENLGGGSPIDGWPREFTRHIATYSDSVGVDLQLCRNGRFLAVLPTSFVDDSGADELQRLDENVLLETPVFSVRREQLIDDDLVTDVLDVLKQTLTP